MSHSSLHLVWTKDELLSIVSRVWEVALPRRRDVLAVAQPGSGKTLAYLLTLAARIMGAPMAAAAGSAATEDGGQAAAAGGNGAAAAVGAASEQPCSEPAVGPPAPRGLVLVPTRSAKFVKLFTYKSMLHQTFAPCENTGTLCNRV